MAQVLWPLVIDQLLAVLPALNAWQTAEVYDGPPVTGDSPSIYCTVGHAEDDESAGEMTREPSTYDYFWDERGSIRCELVLSTGDSVLTDIRTQAFAMIEALDEYLRHNQSLNGILIGGARVSLTVDPQASQVRSVGALLRLPFSVNYFARS